MFEPIKVTISDIFQLTHDVKSYTLDLSGSAIDYLPGQYIQIIAPIEKENCDQRCNIRSYSIASSSTETSKTGKVMIATKFAKANPSIFKKYLINLKVGDKFQIRGPMGRFTIQEDYSKPAVMLSGGIGVTPFRNMIKFANDKKLPLKITLIYSNKTLEDIVWQNEFNGITRSNPNFRIVNTITDQKDGLENWQGERGYINSEMVKKYTEDITNTIFYICGPKVMVDAMKQMLLSMNIAEENIRFELFSGY